MDLAAVAALLDDQDGVLCRRQALAAGLTDEDLRRLPTECLGAVVELDGPIGHELSADRWNDLDRDITSLLVGDTTMRLGWRQVLEPCRTAAVVGRFLRALGWDGDPSSCGPECGMGRAPSSEENAAKCRGRRLDQAQSWPSRASSASSMVPS